MCQQCLTELCCLVPTEELPPEFVSVKDLMLQGGDIWEILSLLMNNTSPCHQRQLTMLKSLSCTVIRRQRIDSLAAGAEHQPPGENQRGH